MREIEISEEPITFNGQEYNSIDEMPQNIRQLYEEVLINAAETGDVPPDMVTADDINGMLAESKNREITSVEDMGGAGKARTYFFYANVDCQCFCNCFNYSTLLRVSEQIIEN